MSETVLQSQKWITETKSVPFHAATSVIGTTVTELARILGLKPLSKSMCVELDITYGIRDDPLDELCEFFLLVRREGAITIFDARNNSIWNTAQNWRTIGTDAGPIQTLQQVQMEFWNPREYDMLTLDNRRSAAKFIIAAVSNVGSTGHVQGVITITSQLLQRTFKGRKPMHKRMRRNR